MLEVLVHNCQTIFETILIKQRMEITILLFLQHQLGETKVIKWQNNLGVSIALHCYHLIFFFGSPY
jgi:hypothetical protein